MGLPCGTCSRARDRKLPGKLHAEGKCPPLRDAAHPFGFPFLKGKDAEKVEKANALYRLAIQILHFAYVHSRQISIENPTRSWLWTILTTLVRDHTDRGFVAWFSNLEEVQFHMCMHGGSRNKDTRLLSTPGLYSSLAAECENQHIHKPWTITQTSVGLQFATAEEAEYPDVLCTGCLLCSCS